MRAPLAVGIVFAEQSGTALVDALERLTQFEVTALCDRTADDDAVRAHLSHEGRRVRRVSELLDDEDVDAIVVAADPETTHELAGLALAADKHVLVAGLIACSAVDAEALVQAAVARQRVLLAVHTTVVDRATSEAKSLIAGGEVGDVYYLRALANACTRHEKLWPLVADEVARIVDLLADEPVEVLAAGTSYGGSNIDLVSCLLRFANGIGRRSTFRQSIRAAPSPGGRRLRGDGRSRPVRPASFDHPLLAQRRPQPLRRRLQPGVRHRRAGGAWLRALRPVGPLSWGEASRARIRRRRGGRRGASTVARARGRALPGAGRAARAQSRRARVRERLTARRPVAELAKGGASRPARTPGRPALPPAPSGIGVLRAPGCHTLRPAAARSQT